jgi:hypothetical protein
VGFFNASHQLISIRDDRPAVSLTTCHLDQPLLWLTSLGIFSLQALIRYILASGPCLCRAYCDCHSCLNTSNLVALYHSLMSLVSSAQSSLLHFPGKQSNCNLLTQNARESFWLVALSGQVRLQLSVLQLLVSEFSTTRRQLECIFCACLLNCTC